MSFPANVKKFQSIEDGTISVLLKVPAEHASSVMMLYKQDIMVVPLQTEIPEDRTAILLEIKTQLDSINRKLETIA